MKTLSEYLTDAGLTQVQFADKIGTTQANVSKLCGESPRISPDMAARIARATGGAVPITAWPQFRVFAQVSAPSSDAATEAAE